MPKLKEGRLRIGAGDLFYLLPNNSDLIQGFEARTDQLNRPMEKVLWRKTQAIYDKDYSKYLVDDTDHLRVIIE